MSMDGPKGPGGPTHNQPVNKPRDPDDRSRASETSKGRSFFRKVARLKEALPLLKKLKKPEAGTPNDIDIGERKIVSSPAKLAENPKWEKEGKKVLPGFPVRKTGDILLSMKARFESPDAASFENKQKLGQIKNTYLTAGLMVLKSWKTELEKELKEAKKADSPALQEKLNRLQEFENKFRSKWNDSQIMNAGSVGQIKEEYRNVLSCPDGMVNDLQKYSSVDQEKIKALFEKSVEELDSHRTDIRNSQLSVPQQGSSGSTHTYRELLGQQKIMYTSAIKVAQQGAEKALASGDISQQRKLGALADQLHRQFKSIQESVALRGGEDPVSKVDKKTSKKLPDALKKLLVDSGMEKRTVAESFGQAQADELNRKGWKLFSQTFEDPNNSKRIMTSEQVPACEMKGVFRTPYDTGAGVSCVDAKNTLHATNLWRSRFTVQGRTVFNGIRHGIADAAGIKHVETRTRAAQNKAEEVLIAALASKPELFEQALKAADTKTMPPPRLLATSTSLVTTGLKSSKERKMQEQQNEAFKALIKKAKENVLELKVPGKDGGLRKVKFEIKLSRFNIPVNYGGVGAGQLVTSGRRLQRSMNEPAMAELVGKGKTIGGDTAFHLRHLDQQIKQKKEEKDSASVEQQAKLNTEIEQLEREAKIVTQLANQIKDIYRRGAHHSEGHDTYKLVARVVYLTHLIGGVPLYNCKSGKDRTAMLDAEVKLLAAQIERDGVVPQPGPLSPEDRALFQSILLNAGNHEVQKANVGVKGYKTEMVDSITERIGDDRIREEVRGLSQVARS